MKTKTIMWVLNIILMLSLSVRITPLNGLAMAPLSFTYCDQTPTVCWHETAHIMDRELGYPSRSERFGETVYMYLYAQIRMDEFNPYVNTIIYNPGTLIYSKDFQFGQFETFSSPQEELYAKLYALARGDIHNLPQGLQQFYSKDARYTTIFSTLVKQGYYFDNPLTPYFTQ